MNKIKFDPFKTFIVLILLGFLVIAYMHTENGRFKTTSTPYVVIDSRTGTLYEAKYIRR